ncbi:MAG: hypothetical protein HW416_3010 [Chloroflexi bacterium]|nr:hypothetical protein [Chloroflexota bacterium]
MIKTKLLFMWIALAALVVGCAPAPSRSGAGDDPGGQPRAAAPKTLTMAVENEPKFLAAGFGDSSADKAASNLRLALSQRLATFDDRGELLPMLAVELPSQERGTWVVRPDGTMQTTYRLQPGVTWHDGAPLTSADVALGWRVMGDKDFGLSVSAVTRLITTIDTPDDSTFVMEWASPYPSANAIVSDDVGPLPAHLLGEQYQREKDRLMDHPYLSHEFVGLGPYRLSEWERGSHLVLKAYDGFYGGRAKIDTLIVRFIPNPSTAVANLLSGVVDGILPRTLDFTQAMFVKDEWARTGKHPVAIAQPTHWRQVYVQFNDPRPVELLDVRTRRAALYALDRQGLVDTLFAGQSQVSDTFFPPDDVKWDWVKDVIARYPYDQRRALDLFGQVGWTRGSDGLLTNAAGERVTFALWTTLGAQYEQEMAIMGDSWKAVGITVDPLIQTQAQNADKKFVASFPSFNPSQIPIKQDQVLARVYGPNCATEENRWNGNNRGCSSVPSLDRANEALQTAIDPVRVRELYRDFNRMLTEELPVLPLYFSVQVVLFREGVTNQNYVNQRAIARRAARHSIHTSRRAKLQAATRKVATT